MAALNDFFYKMLQKLRSIRYIKITHINPHDSRTKVDMPLEKRDSRKSNNSLRSRELS